MTCRSIGTVALAMLTLVTGPASARETARLNLRGTWVMDSAYEVRADGTRITTYGDHPAGLMIVDRHGRYSIQIFRRDRPLFATGDKTRGTETEYREAALGSSTHFGRVHVDTARHQLIFDVAAASFPNWEGKRQVRDYDFAGGLLHYRVPASASGNGTIAHSLWRRASDVSQIDDGHAR